LYRNWLNERSKDSCDASDLNNYENKVRFFNGKADGKGKTGCNRLQLSENATGKVVVDKNGIKYTWKNYISLTAFVPGQPG